MEVPEKKKKKKKKKKKQVPELENKKEKTKSPPDWLLFFPFKQPTVPVCHFPDRQKQSQRLISVPETFFNKRRWCDEASATRRPELGDAFFRFPPGLTQKSRLTSSIRNPPSQSAEHTARLSRLWHQWVPMWILAQIGMSRALLKLLLRLTKAISLPATGGLW